MHTGDNMLAIYASEKALRLAERLGEAAAASRAHGIFGRVFGRIGDSERARENLERSVELARESDPGEAVRALLTLGYHLEVSEADYEGAGEAYREALELAERDRRPAVAGRAARRARPARGPPRRLGGGRARDRGVAELAEREGLTGKLCFPVPDARRAALARRATSTPRPASSGAPHELAEQVGRSEVAFQSLYWLAAALRGSAATTPTPRPSSPGRSTSASAPGLVAQSVEAISARAVNAGARRPAGRGPRGRRGGRAPRRAAALPGRARQPASRRAGRRRRMPRQRAPRCVEARGGLAGARAPARRRALRVPARPPPPRCRSRGSAARARGGRHRRRGIRRRPPGVARARPHPCLTQTGNRTSQFRGLTVPHLTSPACRIWSVRGA